MTRSTRTPKKGAPAMTKPKWTSSNPEPGPMTTSAAATSATVHPVVRLAGHVRAARAGSEVAAGAPPRRRDRARRLAPVGALVVVAVVAAACSSGTSSPSSSASATKATKGARHHAGVVGVVSSVSPTSVTVKVKGTSSTVTLDATTRYREGGKTVAESALTSGDHVRVRLVEGASTPTAAAVAILPPSVTGTVGSLGATGFTLTGRNGTAHTVTTTSSTTYRSGKQTVATSSLHSGDRARVAGQVGPSGAISASTVTILPAKG